MTVMTHKGEMIVAKNMRGNNSIRNLHTNEEQQSNTWVYRVNKNTHHCIRQPFKSCARLWAST